MDKKANKNINDFITAVARKKTNFITAYLFGSHAKGTENEESDIDLALILENLDDSEKFDLQVQLMLLASEYDMRIEPHPISLEDFRSQNPFTNEIKRYGVEVKPVGV